MQRLFVSSCGGTGKSYLIKTIRAWVQAITGKDVAVATPTGIASRNINGLTIHGILVLPVEHGSTPSYRPMSDDALKIVQEKLQCLLSMRYQWLVMLYYCTCISVYKKFFKLMTLKMVGLGKKIY